MIEIYPDTIIYIFCPGNFATGGPEALHQLAAALQKQVGNKVKMVYFMQKELNPVHENYAVYNIPYTTEPEISSTNLMVLPETYLEPIFDPKYQKIRKAIWWLSVTNYYTILASIEKALFKKRFYGIKSRLLPAKYRPIPTVAALKKAGVYHIAHSWFSKVHLSELGFPITGKISDYMNDAFFDLIKSGTQKEDIVVYNPKKNGEYLNKVMALASDIKFVPLVKMTPAEVAGWMNRSKLYVDFGYHPGQERMPREAILTDCCVITGSQGSATYQEDVPLPEGYKFDEQTADPAEVVKQIRFCLNNYDTEILKFNNYKSRLLKEQETFETAIANTFVQIQ